MTYGLTVTYDTGSRSTESASSIPWSALLISVDLLALRKRSYQIVFVFGCISCKMQTLATLKSGKQ